MHSTSRSIRKLWQFEAYNIEAMQVWRHGGHSGAVPPQMSPCAPQKNVPPQAEAVPREFPG